MDSNVTAKSDFRAKQIRASRESGLSRRDWCLENVVFQSTFDCWFRKLQSADLKTDQGSDPVFVRLPSEQEISSGCAAMHTPAMICLSRNVRIEPFSFLRLPP